MAQAPGSNTSLAGERRSIGTIAKELWHQKPGPRAEKPVKNVPITAREIVNGLDRRETTLGIGLTLIACVLALVGYFYQLDSSTTTIHNDALNFLIAMLVGALMLAIGVALKRRALLGFAAFFFGLEQVSFGFVPGGLIYIAFGGWLIWRVMRKTKYERATGINYGTVDTGPRSTPVIPTTSKRYTPPKSKRRR